ncbi:MAG TPA: hypothetical protein ENK66_07780 [Arcobacter sp.]|jgi:tetrahydromethanopterin S-methyltransferase subunit B|nr:hypothetical protein [Arcobacter sp.]
MADMSFKQAQEITERLELAELGIKHHLDNIESATKNFEKTLQKQQMVLQTNNKTDNKLVVLKILVGINFGFVVGVIIGKFFL